jgi:hypothetical protein
MNGQIHAINKKTLLKQTFAVKIFSESAFLMQIHNKKKSNG